jgi:hypothetical protein
MTNEMKDEVVYEGGPTSFINVVLCLCGEGIKGLFPMKEVGPPS